MLGLHNTTSDEWIEAANRNAASVLIDHAHCEKKAAVMAISLLNRYPEKSELVELMAALAEEEIGHFRMVLHEMSARGIALTKDPGDFYAQQLHTNIRTQESFRLLDTLIVCSLIEARSCERFQLLSRSVEDEGLRGFYRSLLESEARHRTTFLSLARLYFSNEEVTKRLHELEEIEADIVSRLQSAPVMHG